MKIFLKYGIPPLVPLFLMCCTVIMAAEYLSVFKGKSFFQTFPALPENHIFFFTDKGMVNITGTICSSPEDTEKLAPDSDRRVKFDLSVEIVQKGAGNAVSHNRNEQGVVYKNITGMIQVNIYNPVEIYRIGDRICFSGKIKSFRNFNNQGGFDYARHMKRKNIWGRASADGKNITLCRQHGADIKNNRGRYGYYRECINNFREIFASHIFESIEDRDSAAILCALVTGNTGFISGELTSDFSKTGVSHILSVSGLHLSIVAAFFFYIFNIILSCSGYVLIRGWAKKGAAILTLLPIAGYSILAGNSDATQRSMIMIIIFMAAGVIERESDMFNSLSAAGILILVMEPLALFSISFQLSFSAVFFILMGLSLSSRYSHNFPYLKSFVSRKLAGFILVSICATAGTQILVMRYFNLFSFSGLLTNIVIIPGIGIAALYLGFAALFLYPVSIHLSGLTLKYAAVIIKPSVQFIRYIAGFPWSHAETFTPDNIEIACYYLFLSALFVAAKSWKNKENSKIIFNAGVFGIVLSFIVIVIHEWIWINKRFFSNNMSVTVLDVGQGNSALIQMPEGKNFLVDGGGFSYSGKFDTGADIIAPFLRYQKIMNLDAVILTHPDSDHLNGLVYIVDHFRPKRFIKNCDSSNSPAYINLMEKIRKNGVEVSIIDDNVEPVIQIDTDVSIRFFHPLGPCLPEPDRELSPHQEQMELVQHSTCDRNRKNPAIEMRRDTNNNSLVFKVIFRKTSVMFPGDIMAEAEDEISSVYSGKPVAGKISLKSDILVAPHHGSSSSSTEAFLDKVSPESIVISCGWQNRFGFPQNAVLSRYRKLGIRVFRTDLNGAVSFSSDGTQWEITPFM